MAKKFVERIIVFIVCKKIYLCIILLILSVLNVVNAASIDYQDCYMPWEFGNEEKSYVIVRPIGNKCYKVCQNQCSEFSQPSYCRGQNCYELSQSELPLGLAGTELNQDIIDKCLLQCYQGETNTGSKFLSDYRIRDDSSSNIFGWKWSGKEITTSTSCAGGEIDLESANFAYFPINFNVKNGDEVYFSLAASDSDYGNTVFLCGFETKRITPLKWYDNKSEKSLYSSANYWDAKNGQWYDTGIKVKKGDYLRIAYGGKFFGKYEGSKYIPNKNDLNLLFNGTCENKDYFPGQDLSTCFFYRDEQQSYCMDSNNRTILCKDGNCQSIFDNTQKLHEFCSLRATRSSLVRKNIKINGSSKKNYPLDKFEFEGYAKGLELDSETLFLKYHGVGDYKNNFGGYEVEVSRKGCPYHNGEGLQYAIISKTTDSYGQSSYQPWNSNVLWHDAAQYLSRGTKPKKVPIDSDGRIYFRIDPSKIEGNRVGTAGSYGIIVNKKSKQKDGVSGIISDIVNTITKFFIGDGKSNSNTGKVQNIFKKLIANPLFINSIRALLVFYISYTGISYMVGFAKTTQKEAIIRILKITIIAILISPKSWEFFNFYLFSFLMNGSMELTYHIVEPFATIAKINTEKATHFELVRAVFGMYDQIYYQLFHSIIWIKMWALTCTSLIGAFLVILIIIAIVSYTICTIRIIIIYLCSVITLSILFILAPIFISFILFEKTSKMFKSWINNMLSMVFQPIFAFSAIAILYKIFLMTLYAALSFTACPTCLFAFDILDYHLCLPPIEGFWWVALHGAHIPLTAPMLCPIKLLTPVFSVLILAQAMDGMVKLALSFASHIATNSFYGFDLGGVGGAIQNYTSQSITGTAETILGVGSNYDVKENGNRRNIQRR